MKHAKFLIFVLIIITTISPLLTFGQTLKITNHHPDIDGIISSGEYSMVIKIKNGYIYLSRTNQNIYAAIKAETTGWVAMGFNSLKMNSADIIIGYVNKKEKVIKTQKGVGRTHRNFPIPYVIKSAISEKKGYTTLEVALRIGEKPSDLSLKGATFNMITAYGTKDNLKSYHKFRKPISVKLN